MVIYHYLSFHVRLLYAAHPLACPHDRGLPPRSNSYKPDPAQRQPFPDAGGKARVHYCNFLDEPLDAMAEGAALIVAGGVGQDWGPRRVGSWSPMPWKKRFLEAIIFFL